MDGTVYTFGDNEYGQLGNGTTIDSEEFIDLSAYFMEDEKIVSISANGYHTLALSNMGNLYGWERNNYFQVYSDETEIISTPVLVHQFEEEIKKIDVGGYSSFILTESGTIYCWGFNGYGNLGVGDTYRGQFPGMVYRLEDNVCDFSAGKQHIVALTKDRKVFAWGRNDYGQISKDISNVYFAFPYEIPDVYYDSESVDRVKAGGNTTCIITDYDIYMWGDNEYYQLGKQTNEPIVRVTSFANYNDDTYFGEYDIALGECHSVFITEQKQVYTCGKNNHGQLALGEYHSKNSASDVTDKFLIKGISFFDDTVKDIYSFDVHSNIINGLPYNIKKQNENINYDKTYFVYYSEDSYILDVGSTSGSINSIQNPGNTAVYAVWLENAYLINRDFNNEEYVDYIIKYPIWVYDIPSSDISSGKRHSFFITKNGTLNGWGYNNYGQLGFEKKQNRTSPIDISHLFNDKIVSVKTGYHHTLVLTGKGQVYAFGYNDYGQIGDNSTTHKSTPVLIEGFDSPVEVIEAKARQSFAITKSGKIYAWGRNNYGQLGTGTTTNQYEPVELTHNFEGEKAKDIVAGDYSAYLLTETGKVFSWGFGSKGNLGDGTVSSKVTPVNISHMFNGEKIIKIASGSQHVIVMTDEANAYMWGYNDAGQLGETVSVITPVPKKLENQKVKNVFAGEKNTAYITHDNKIYLTGENSYNQLGVSSDKNISEISYKFYYNIKNISFGEGYTVVTTKDNKVYTVGNNSYGQLGDGTLECSQIFKDISSLLNKNRFLTDGEAVAEYIFPSENGKEHFISVNLKDVIVDNNEILIRYDTLNLELQDICLLTPYEDITTGKVDNTNITILGIDEENGKIRFKYTDSENNDKYYTGTVNSLKFIGKKNGITYVRVELIDKSNEGEE